MKTGAQRVQAALDLLAASGDVEAAFLLSRDGVALASVGAAPRRSDELVSMTAAMMGAAVAAIEQVMRGRPDRLVIDVQTRRFVIVPATRHSWLALVTRDDWQEEAGMQRLATTVATLRMALPEDG